MNSGIWDGYSGANNHNVGTKQSEPARKEGILCGSRTYYLDHISSLHHCSSQAVEKSPFGNRFQLIHERGPRRPHQIQRGSIHFISLSYEKDGESVNRRAKRVAEGESSVTTTIEEYVTALTLPYPLK